MPSENSFWNEFLPFRIRIKVEKLNFSKLNSEVFLKRPCYFTGYLTGFFLFFMSILNAQEFPQYDELVVDMNVPKLGTFDLPIAIKEEEAFLSIASMFESLRIKYDVDEDSQAISGFLLSPQNRYQIIPHSHTIIIGGEVHQLPEETFIYTPMEVYLRSDVFGAFFQLDTEFNFRTLSLDVETDLELPVIREMRLQRMRNNIQELRGEVVPDTTMEREFHMLRGAAIDWGVITTQQSEGINESRFNLGLGGMLAGGEANVFLNYSDRIPFQSRNQFYQWRYVNNSNEIFKQVTFGKINSRATSTLFAPVVGMQFTNSPLKNRRSFGSYTLSDITEPGWTVELYVNNILIDYMEADASGFFKFEVPLMYGNTNVNLRFYGPWGEERTEEQVISIPYNFLPKNELEYTFNAGVVENDLNSKFTRFELNYGLGRSMTVGAGVEYLSTLREGEQIMPFVTTSMSLASNLLFSGNYTYGVKAEGLLSYRSSKGLQINLNYINYDKNQTAITYNYLEERKISLSMPVRTSFLNAYARMSVNQIVLPSTQFTSGQLLLSGQLFGINTNLTTYVLFNDQLSSGNIYSTLSQSYRLPYRFLFIPQVQYDFDSSELTNVILRIERQVFERGYLNVGFENNFSRDTNIFELGFRYTFNFGQTSASARIGKEHATFMQSARGSLFLDDQSGAITFSNRSNVGKAAVSVIPFLDLNGNGIKDKLEPGVPGLVLGRVAGQQMYNEDRTEIRIFDLEPYVPLTLEIDPISLDNIAWNVEHKMVQLEPLPNQVNTVFVPVTVLGEVAGMVYFKDGGSVTGLGRVIVNILDEKGRQVTRILSEGDGYFTYLGLKPGKYVAEIDSEQLENLNFTSKPSEARFEIEIDQYGDIVDTLEFVLSSKESAD